MSPPSIALAPRWCPLLLLLLTAPALAAERATDVPLPVDIDYEAPSECPTAAVFRRELESQLTKPLAARTPSRSETDVIVHVRIRRTAQRRYTAELTTKTSDGSSTPRTLEGPDCAALTEALAFTTALALEPEGRRPLTTEQEPGGRRAAPGQDERAPGDQTSSGATGPRSDDREAGVNTSQAAQPARGAPAEVPSPSSKPQASDAADLEEYVWDLPSRTSAPGFWTSAVGAGFSLASPLTTGFDSGVYATLSAFRETRADAGVWTWTPAFSLSVHVLRSPWTGTGDVASFHQTTVQASFCPNRIREGDFAWALCATGQYGALFAYGEHLSNPNRTQAPVASAGATLWLQYALGSHLTVSGHVGALAELRSHEFRIGLENAPVAESRTISPWLGLGVSTPL